MERLAETEAARLPWAESLYQMVRDGVQPDEAYRALTGGDEWGDAGNNDD